MNSYTFRGSLLDTAITYVIRDDELVLRRGDGFEEFIRLSEVRSVRLRSGRTRIGCEWQECIVRTGHRSIRISSLHRIGFRRFESRDHAYRRFLGTLHRALLPYAENVRFVRGSNYLLTRALMSFACRRRPADYEPADLMQHCAA